MLVIPMYQPYASAAALQLKTIETRPGRIFYRGWVAIHSCKSWPTLYRQAFEDLPSDIRVRIANWSGERWGGLPFGKIIAVGKLIDCLPVEKFQRHGTGRGGYDNNCAILSPLEEALGNYEDGRYGWILSGIRALKEPLPYRAHQGCYQLSPDIVAEVKRRAV